MMLQFFFQENYIKLTSKMKKREGQVETCFWNALSSSALLPFTFLTWFSNAKKLINPSSQINPFLSFFISTLSKPKRI